MTKPSLAKWNLLLRAAQLLIHTEGLFVKTREIPSYTGLLIVL